MYEVKVAKNRPDFRVFLDLLYGVDRNVDTEGNSHPVNSRTWTYLSIKDRESGDPRIELCAKKTEPSIFEVKSESTELEEVTAFYLFLYCGISISVNGKSLSRKDIKELEQKHALRLKRAEEAVWHQSSDDNPYPNLAQ